MEPIHRIGYWWSEKKSRKFNMPEFSRICRSAGLKLIKSSVGLTLPPQIPNTYPKCLIVSQGTGGPFSDNLRNLSYKPMFCIVDSDLIQQYLNRSSNITPEFLKMDNKYVSVIFINETDIINAKRYTYNSASEIPQDLELLNQLAGFMSNENRRIMAYNQPNRVIIYPENRNQRKLALPDVEKKKYEDDDEQTHPGKDLYRRK